MEALGVIREIPPALREPNYLMGMVYALADAPSEEREELFFKLAEEDPRFFVNDMWRTAALQLGTLSSARQLFDLIACGDLFGQADDWLIARKIGGLIEAYPDLRSHLYNLLRGGTTTPRLATLARAVAESPDDDGLLLLLQCERGMKRTFVTWQTIERLVTEHVPTSDWGAYEVVPVPAENLRQKLLALTTDGGAADAAARWLRQIDLIRDQYGMPQAEPRHPDLASGRLWPIMHPDPDATAEG